MDPRNTRVHSPAGEPVEEVAWTPPDDRRARTPRRLAIALAVILVVGGAGSIVRVPLHSIGPGPARDVLDLIKVEGAATHPSRGQLLLTTARVSGAPLSLWEVAYVWIHPALETTPRRTIVQPGFTDEQRDAQDTFDMEQSKLQAELAAFDALGRPAVRIRGARVVSVIENGPSEGVLKARDVIRAIDGADVATPEHAVEAIRRHAVGDRVSIVVLRGGSERTVEVRTEPSGRDPDVPVIGAFLASAYRLPNQVEIDTQQIGGPSGGLVFALAIVDALTPEDLTRGHVVAATGTIERGSDGVARVGVIGAVPEKVRAAADAGATVFMLPARELDEARRAAPEGMIVIGVETLSEAIEELRRLSPPAESGAAGD